MDSTSEWRIAFPLQSAVAASEALLQAWHDLASWPSQDFNPKSKEPNLTKRLKIYVEDHVGPRRGLLGMWAAENFIGRSDRSTGKLEVRRTDIEFGWNDNTRQFKLVFEFKRLRQGKRYRDQYLGEQGLARFVTGIYGKGQAIAAMVGVLLAPEADIVPPIKAALADPNRAKALRLRKSASGQPYTEPSTLFPKAVFDTEHYRSQALAPSHGYISVAHFFVKFG